VMLELPNYFCSMFDEVAVWEAATSFRKSPMKGKIMPT
jgi:hypothetical protein